MSWVKTEIANDERVLYPAGQLIKRPLQCRECGTAYTGGVLAIRRDGDEHWTGSCVCLRHAGQYLGGT